MSNKIPYLNVFTVEEFDGAAGKTVRNWTKIGVAFPHADTGGFNIELRAFPRDGKLVVLPPQSEERDERKGASSSSDTAVAAKPDASKDRSR
jgi:hypothetical protein